MEYLAKDKHSSLLRKFVNDFRKKWKTLGPWACIIKLFTDVINGVVQKASAFAIVSHFLLA
jgi:hypothetical protein